MKYIIKCLNQTRIGFIGEILTTDNNWCIATSNAAYFGSAMKAAEYFFKQKEIPLRGSEVWIEGPHGGRYSITGRYLK